MTCITANTVNNINMKTDYVVHFCLYKKKYRGVNALCTLIMSQIIVSHHDECTAFYALKALVNVAPKCHTHQLTYTFLFEILTTIQF